MKKEDIIIGIKVVPHDKTVDEDYYGGLDKSNVWKRAQENDQPYLYLVGYSELDNAYILNNKNIYDGDFFNIEDFEPYNEVDNG
jgi:hypothetical protein